MKKNLLEEVGILLLRNGFTVRTLTRSCFDVLARKGSRILLIKILQDANSITREFAEEMERVSYYISALPLVIAEKAGSFLEDNVVYTRFGVCTLTPDTLRNCIDNKLPFLRRSHAGPTASVLGEKLKQKREELGYSLNALSRKIGVSQRMILKYETGSSEVSFKRALELYKLFGESVFRKIDVFSLRKKIGDSVSGISRKYNELGFESSETKKVPFDIVAKKEDEIILTELGDKTNPQFLSISKLIDADSLVIFKEKKPKEIPALTKKEFLEFESANELIKFLKEFE